MTATDAALSTRPLPEGVTATPVWGAWKREDGTPKHRYRLLWTHAERAGVMNVVIGMNPSGASAEVADQTLLKTWGFCGRWSNGPLLMTNVVAFRATSPSDMEIDPVAEDENLHQIRRAVQIARRTGSKARVVAAWGTPGLPKALRAKFDARVLAVHTMLREMNVPLLCLGTTRDGSPTHPLLIAYDTPLKLWIPR